jgi:hypothetical protein
VTKTQTATILINGVSLDVDYTHHPAERGVYEKGGLQISPDEDAYNEVEDVRVSGTAVSIMGLIDEFNGIDIIEAELSLESDEEGNEDE